MKNEEQPLFVSDPQTNKEGMSSYTSYTLQGSKLSEGRSRRYRDFDALRKKMVERWPGIYIPNIPHKKYIGNQDKETIGLRMQMLNLFLKKICQINYLYKSEELTTFLEASNDIRKNLDNLKPDTIENLLRKYSQVFTDYDDNFDVIEGKKEQEEFSKKLLANYPKLKEFRHLVFQEKENYYQTHKIETKVLNLITLYEKNILTEFVDQDEDKKVLFNMKNIELCKDITNTQEKMINPYDRLYQSLTEDYLATEAMKDALDGLKYLQDYYMKLTRNLTTTNVALNDLQAGKTSIKNIFGKRDGNINKLTQQKEKLETDIDHLGQIIKISTFNMQNQIKNFKVKSLEHYYAQLARIKKDTESNAKLTDDLWETVCKDPNISSTD